MLDTESSKTQSALTQSMHDAWSKNNAWDAQDARQKNHTHWVHIVHARQDCSGGVEQRERY